VQALFVLGAAAQASLCANVDVTTIIKKSVAANQADFKAAPRYSYREREKRRTVTKHTTSS